MTDQKRMDVDSLRLVAHWAAVLERHLDDSITDLIPGYLSGTLRVWHGNGFSPGYFTNEGEDFWWFVPDYQEPSDD